MLFHPEANHRSAFFQTSQQQYSIPLMERLIYLSSTQVVLCDSRRGDGEAKRGKSGVVVVKVRGRRDEEGGVVGWLVGGCARSK